MSKTALSAAAALCLLCSCSSSHTYATKDGTVSIEAKGKDDATVHIVGKDGASADFNTNKPITGYPQDTPLYQGKGVMDMKTEKPLSRVVTVETSDSMEKIADFYKTQLASKGWKTDSTMTTAQMTMFSAMKDGNRLAVSITTDGTKQTVTQSLGQK